MELLTVLGGLVAVAAAELIILFVPIVLWAGEADGPLTRKGIVGLWVATYGAYAIAAVLIYAALSLFGVIK